jgi:hypothetical protein
MLCLGVLNFHCIFTANLIAIVFSLIYNLYLLFNSINHTDTITEIFYLMALLFIKDLFRKILPQNEIYAFYSTETERLSILKI